jgi:tetratricopeptide (TPR) repeat protein
MMANNINEILMVMDIAEQDKQSETRSRAIAVAWGGVFLLTILAYWPGLQGPFVLDDFSSLGALGNMGAIQDWDSFKAFVFGGTAGPTGRPLALLSFLIDGNNWPTDPWPFKRTNLVIHLLNGALLGILTRQILQVLDFDRESATRLALVSAAAWMLHPFLVSTTLYAVQRMAQLAMLFSIAGMITYLYGRSLLGTNKTKAYLVMTLSLGTFTVLATLSKENGVLLPMLIGVVEITIFASRGAGLPGLDRRWSLVFLGIPSLFIVGYLGYRFFSVDFLEMHGSREFSLYERLLTQPRVVADYLQNWFLPKLYTTGVFQDHVMKSTGLFAPLSTAVGAVFHLGLIVLAFVKRRQQPLLAFAILFFYASHLLESTTLSLELYFEHRNYIAAGFLFLPLIVLLRDKLSRQMGLLAVATVLLVLAGFTRFSATVWSNYDEMIVASAQKAPTSARAQAELAIVLFNAGQYEQSLQVLDRAIELIGNDNPLLLLNRLVIRCNLRVLQPHELDAAVTALSPKIYDPRYLKHYAGLSQAISEGRCPGVALEQLRPLYASLLQNPGNTESGSLALSHIKYLAGSVDLQADNIDAAMRQFLMSLEAKPDAGSAMTMAAMVATAGYPEEALLLSERALEYLDVESRGVRLGLKVTEKDILEFRAIVTAEIQGATD